MIRLETRDLTGQPARALDLIELAVGDPARPARARLADVCIKSETGGSRHGREAAGLPTVMELAGLEPATSWVRSTRKASSAVAILRHVPLFRGCSAWVLCRPLAVLCRGYLTKT
jgi:hypothetical protein